MIQGSKKGEKVRGELMNGVVVVERESESCRRRAGFTETRSHLPLQNPAKSDQRRGLNPDRMAYAICWRQCIFLSIR